MDYQNLIDATMAAPARPGLAPQASALVKAAARRLGRQTEPELAGVPNLLLRPNQEEPMSGEIAGGHVVDGARPQYHRLDPILPPEMAREAMRTLLPVARFASTPQPGLAPTLLPLAPGRAENPLARRPPAAVPAMLPARGD